MTEEIKCTKDGTVMTRYDSSPPYEMLGVPQWVCSKCGAAYKPAGD